MKDNQYDILIIGGGITGAAIFFHAIKETNKRVALLEQQRFCNGATGSSGGLVRVLHNSVRTSELALHSLDEFQNFEKITGHSCGFTKTGFFSIENQNLLDIEQKIKLISNNNFAVEFFSTAQARNTFSNISLPAAENDLITYEPNAGYADPVKTTLAYVNAGMKMGGLAFENTEVLEILTKKNQVSGVKTTHGVFEAPHVVIAAGTASNNLLHQFNIKRKPLTAKAIQIAFYNYPVAIKPVATFFNKISGLYGRHYSASSCFFGITQLNEVDDIAKTRIDAKVNHSIEILAKTDFPWLKDSLWQGSRCAADAYTENHEGIAEFLDEPKGLFLCAGWSGVGFKLAPEIAKRTVKQLAQFC
jgi:sarcosine oxidase subunit beta